MGTTFNLVCWLALCCTLATLGSAAADSSSTLSDHHVDQLLTDTEQEVREWFAKKPIAVEYANVTSRSHKKRTAPGVHELGVRNAILAYATDRLAKRFELPREEAEVRIQTRASLRAGFNANDICNRARPSCNVDSPFRNVDGSCNNLANPTWGMAVSTFDRILSPSYDDGFGTFRRSVVNRQELLSPRIIRLIVHPERNILHNFITNMVVGFGQFLDHDITSTPEGQNLNCCTNQNNPECMHFPAPDNDDFYQQFGIRCIEIARSVRACGGGVRQQINQASSYIDGSQIYGNSDAEQNALRSFRNGMLVTDTNTRLLPKDNAAQSCGIPQQGITCFKAGDDRLNENPGLTSLHTIFMREHNRIATNLRAINPQWNDQNLFDATKRIVVAELQSITYNEYLPVILGTGAINIFRLNITASVSTTYNPNTRGIIFNEFATAAYRFGHTLIPNNYSMPGNGEFSLANAFQNPSVIYQQAANIDRIMNGFATQPSQAYDNFMSQAVTNHLFQGPAARFGSDLASLNIRRGQDHGLRPYVDYRAYCGMSVPQDINGLPFNSESIARFTDSYRSVKDIDLWPAGISEPPVSGGVMGDTFACINGEQFARLLYGDRFFFTHAGQKGSFTPNQVANLKQRTLASIICDNASPTVTSLPSNVFLQRGGTPMSCSNHVKLNIQNWRTSANGK